MSDESAFLRTIIDSPDDDTPRLVFSDWLEENGRSAQAEFIRIQIRLARMNSWDEGFTELRQREQVLIRKYGSAWMEPIEPFLHPAFQRDHWYDYEELGIFRRGMIDTAFVDGNQFLEDPDTLLNSAPITGLILLVDGPLPDEWLNCGTLERIRRLKFMSSRNRGGQWGLEGIELHRNDFLRLANCPHLEQLRTLDLSSQTVPAHGIVDLVRSRHLSNLETFSLVHSDR